MLSVGFILLAAGRMPAAEDAREIVRRSVEIDRKNQKLIENYTYVERQDQRETDKQGKVTRHTVRTYDVTISEGSPYRRLIARDDKPLPPAEEQAEAEKLRKSLAARKAETPAQRARRIEDWRKRRDKQREFMREFLDAFDFRLAGETVWDGRRMHDVFATPRAGFRPQTSAGKFLTKMKGRLWIDAETYDWARAEADVLDTVWIMGFALRLNPGAHISLEQTRVNGEIWLPKHMRAVASGRILLLKRFGGEWDYRYSDYRKFQADSRILSVEDPK